MDTRTLSGRFGNPVMAGALLLLTMFAAPAAAWEPPVWVSADGQTTGLLSPRVVVDGKGNAYYAFSGVDGPHWRYLVARKPAGAALEPAVEVSPAGGTVWDPQIKADKKGNVVAAWSFIVTGGEEYMQVATKPKKSTAFEPPATISPQGIYDAVALERDNKGNTTVVWQEASGISGAVGPKKGPFGAPVAISTGPGLFPFVAADKKGNTLVLWHGNDGMGVRIHRSFRPAKGDFGPAQAISGGTFDIRPTAAFDKKGNATAIWAGDELTMNFSATFSDMTAKTSGTFGAPAGISADSSTISGQQVAFDRKGNALAVWTRLTGGTYRIEVATRPAGGAFGVTSTISNPLHDAGAPRLAIDGKGNAHVIWGSYDGADYRIQVATRPAGGVFGTPEVLYEGPEAAAFPDIAADKKGNLFAAWSREDGMTNRLEGSWQLLP